ncbi:MAG: integration host factor subunit beta [Sphaerochaetaceae bacterium]|jgi:integration host factor subunit beta|nr:integration host factor subunit beta [Sphaerochaetaceae bacterium]MDC7236659.1 integration host factor subunit beta [Sphaerochaetaceae bacterium]MDC7248368.1 integration host factor subunit beta [Sphaerochaetaceae bacterium]
MAESKKLTKSIIIDNLYSKLKERYEETDITKAEIHMLIDEFFEEVKDGLKKDQVIELRGFGTFEVHTRKQRDRAHNPKTGAPVTVDTHGVAFFRPGRELKERVWNLRG